MSPDEVDDLSDDPVTVLTATAEVVPPGPAPEPVVTGPTPFDQVDDVIEDAELVDPDDMPATPAEKGATKASLEIVKGNGSFQAVSDAMKAEDIPMAATKWTKTHAARIQQLCELLGGA